MLSVDAAKERKKAYTALKKSNALALSAAPSRLGAPTGTGLQPIVQNITNNNIRNYFRGLATGGTVGGGSNGTSRYSMRLIEFWLFLIWIGR